MLIIRDVSEINLPKILAFFFLPVNYYLPAIKNVVSSLKIISNQNASIK